MNTQARTARTHARTHVCTPAAWEQPQAGSDLWRDAHSKERRQQRPAVRVYVRERTRMLVHAMEVAGIDGTFRHSCERMMSVLRANRDSLISMLEVGMSWG